MMVEDSMIREGCFKRRDFVTIAFFVVQQEKIESPLGVKKL